MLQSILSFLALLLVVATADVVSYKAASVQRKALPRNTQESATAWQNRNFEMFLPYMQIAKKNHVDFINFPEFTLGLDHSSKDALRQFGQTLPCGAVNFTESPPYTGFSTLLQQASNYTVTVGIDMCFNMVEASNCNDSGVYNTEICLNRTGFLVAKYRKSHPFWGVFDAPSTPDIVTYTTSFGVRFGILTCKDILYPNPADDLSKLGITHFPYSVAVSAGSIGPDGYELWSRIHNGTIMVANDDASSKEGGIFTRGRRLDATMYEMQSDQNGFMLTSVVN